MASRLDHRPVVIRLDAEGQRALEGVFVPGSDPGDMGAVIGPPHPLYGGSMESPVVSEIAWGCQRARLAWLAFNWRGVGGSWGEPSGEARDAEEDYRAATEHLEECVGGPLVACGYSFGSAAAVRVASARPRIRRLVLVAPPPALLPQQELLQFRGRVLGIAGESDAFAPASELAELFARLPRGELLVVPEADHFFQAGLPAISRSIADWL